MTSDARAQQAREHHRALDALKANGGRHREARNRLVRELRAEDPVRWTYPALAAAVDCSPELIAAIISGRT